MKEFLSFEKAKKWEKCSADKTVDEALEAIVADARKYKELMDTTELQRQSFLFNNKKVSQIAFS